MPTATIDVDSEVYLSAGATFLRVNDAVCDVVTSAATAAGSGGGMAGSDAAAARWAATYDLGARLALEAGATVADRLGEFGLRLVGTGDNHDGADASSVPGAPSYGGSSTTPSPGRVIPAAPPSAVGGSASPPTVWALVAHLLPFSWPGGDPNALRAVAAGWADAATSLQCAADRLSGPVGDISAQRSPEVDAAVSRCADAQLAVRSLAEQYAALGRACTMLADHLQAARDQLAQALADVGDLASAGLDVVTAAVTGDDVEQKLQDLIETLRGVLDHLVALIAGAVEALDEVLDEITMLIRRLADLVTTAVTTAFTVAAASAAAVTGIGQATDPGVDLTAMEAAGGHTIERHVGKSDADLETRAREGGYDQTSSFADLATAETLTASNVAANAAWITRWLGKQKAVGQLVVRSDAPATAGRIYDAATDSFVAPTTVVTVLEKTGRGTFIVLTSYLEP